MKGKQILMTYRWDRRQFHAVGNENLYEGAFLLILMCVLFSIHRKCLMLAASWNHRNEEIIHLDPDLTGREKKNQ